MNKFKYVAMLSIALIAAVTLSLNTNAQEKKITKKHVPQVVLSAFEKAYPDAKVKSYTTEKENGKTYFEIESMRGKSTLDVSYLSDGSAAEVEEGVLAKDLPAPVTKAVETKYPKGKIVKAEKRTADNMVSFELKVKTGKTHVGLRIDPDGKNIKEHKANSKKEGKEGEEKD